MEQSNGRFEDISYKEYGKYIQVEMKGDNGIYRIVSGEDNHILVICLAGGAIILLAIITIVARLMPHKDT